jgi:hypothetical protein
MIKEIIEKNPQIEMEYMVGREIGKSLEEVRQLPMFEFFGWVEIIKKYGAKF